MTFVLLGILNAQAAGGVTPTEDAYDLLETTTLGTAASSVTFSGLGSYSAYRHLQIRYVGRSTTNSATTLQGRLNGDSGTNYSRHRLFTTGPSVSSDGTTSNNEMNIGTLSGTDSTSDVFSGGVLDLLDFASTNKNTTIRSFSGVESSSKYLALFSAAYLTTSAITSIDIFSFSGNIVAGSRFSLYGVKG